MTSVEHVFGIDGGGSGCRVAVCDLKGRQLAQARGGPANYFTDPDAAIRNVLAAVQDAITQLPTGALQLRNCAAHIGLAGVLCEADKAHVAQAMPFGLLAVTDDGVTSVAGALGQADGVLASVGTGSFVAAQRGGTMRFVGGWGAQLGDQASGCWLGMQALRRAVLAHDALVAQSGLTQHIMAHCGGSRRKVLQFVKDARPADYADLAPSIVDAAQAGDHHGKEMMREGALYLTSCMKAVGVSDDDLLCLTGSLGPHYLDYFADHIRSRVQPPLGSPLDGAVLLAQKLRDLDSVARIESDR